MLLLSESRGTTKSEYMRKAIKLFKIVLNRISYFLPAYENLIYIYKEQNEDKKALSTYLIHLKKHDKINAII